MEGNARDMEMHLGVPKGCCWLIWIDEYLRRGGFQQPRDLACMRSSGLPLPQMQSSLHRPDGDANIGTRSRSTKRHGRELVFVIFLGGLETAQSTKCSQSSISWKVYWCRLSKPRSITDCKTRCLRDLVFLRHNPFLPSALAARSANWIPMLRPPPTSKPTTKA